MEGIWAPAGLPQLIGDQLNPKATAIGFEWMDVSTWENAWRTVNRHYLRLHPLPPPHTHTLSLSVTQPHMMGGLVKWAVCGSYHPTELLIILSMYQIDRSVWPFSFRFSYRRARAAAAAAPRSAAERQQTSCSPALRKTSSLLLMWNNKKKEQ